MTFILVSSSAGAQVNVIGYTVEQQVERIQTRSFCVLSELQVGELDAMKSAWRGDRTNTRSLGLKR